MLYVCYMNVQFVVYRTIGEKNNVRILFLKQYIVHIVHVVLYVVFTLSTLVRTYIVF